MSIDEKAVDTFVSAAAGTLVLPYIIPTVHRMLRDYNPTYSGRERAEVAGVITGVALAAAGHTLLLEHYPVFELCTLFVANGCSEIYESARTFLPAIQEFLKRKEDSLK